jgi:hypothetical protein
MFAIEFRDVKGKQVQLKFCPHHRKKAREAAKTPAGKANRERNRKTANGLKNIAEYRKSDKRKAVLKKFNASEKRKVSGRKYRSNPKGKANAKKAFRNWYVKMTADDQKRMMYNIRKMLSFMLTGQKSEFQSFNEITGISKAEWISHFELLWDTGMDWSNYGDTEGCWHVGHRIPFSAFDPADEEDVRNCWDPDNLFPQWRDENHRNHNNWPSKEELQPLLHLLPKRFREGDVGLLSAHLQ